MNAGIGLVALLMSVAWLPIPSAISTPRWCVIALGCFFLLCFTLIRMTTEHVLGIAVLAWCALTSLWSISPVDTVGAMIRVLPFVAAFLIAAETKSLTWFYIALAAGATVNAGIAIAQMNGFAMFDHVSLAAGVPIGTFGNKNFLANFAVLALIGSLSLSFKAWWPVIIGSGVAAFLPMSRGAMMAFGVGIAVRYWRNWFALVMIAGAAAVCADMYLTPGRLWSSAAPRLDMWDWTISNFKFFGWGYGTFGTIFPFDHASNDFLEIVFELGVGSTLSFCFFATLLTRSLGRTESAILAAAMVEACTAFPLHQPATLFVVAVVAGRLAGEHGRRRIDQPVGGDSSAECLSFPWPLSTREVHATTLSG